jgi:hypothetical protein
LSRRAVFFSKCFRLERQTAENIADGMSPEEARQAAMRTFGNPTVVREQVHETWSVFIYSPGSEPEVVDGDYVVGDRPAEEFSIFLDQIWRLDVYKRLY